MVDAPTPPADEPNPFQEEASPRGESPLSVDTLGGAYEDRPELFVGAAFVGGFVVAQILKKVRQ
jgi:hypothetical protein